MSFKVIDLRSGTKGVLHQWRHTGSKSREILWYICKYPGRGPLATRRRITGTTRYNSMGRRLPAALHGFHPGWGKTKGSSERPAPHSGYVWTKDHGSVHSKDKDRPWHLQSDLQALCTGKGGRGWGKQLCQYLQVTNSFTVTTWYQAQHAHFVDNYCVRVENFVEWLSPPKTSRLVAQLLKAEAGLAIKDCCPLFHFLLIRLPLTKWFRHHLEISTSFITGLSFRKDGFSNVSMCLCALWQDLTYFSEYFTMFINSKVAYIAINSKSSGSNLYTSSALLILDLKLVHETRWKANLGEFSAFFKL